MKNFKYEICFFGSGINSLSASAAVRFDVGVVNFWAAIV